MMRAPEYAPATPLDEPPPAEPAATLAQRRDALLDALRGLHLGLYDETMVGWIVDHLDDAACRTLVSWLLRARGAGVLDIMGLVEATVPVAVGRAPVPEPDLEVGDWVEAGSGPGLPIPRHRRHTNER